MQSTVEEQTKHQGLGINAIEAVYRALGVHAEREHLEEHVDCLSLRELKDFFKRQNFLVDVNFLFSSIIKRNSSRLKKFMPCIVPVQSAQGESYIVVECITKGKLRVYNPASCQTTLLRLADLLKLIIPTPRHFYQSSSSELVCEKIFDCLSSYNIDATLIEKVEYEGLSNIVTYFLYIKECFGFISSTAERDFLVELLEQYEGDSGQAIKNDVKEFIPKVEAPLALTVKLKSKTDPTRYKEESINDLKNPYWKLFKELQPYHKLWGIYISSSIVAAMFGQFTIFSGQILIDHILPNNNLNFLILFVVALGIFKLFDLILSLYKSFVAIHLGNILDDYFLSSFIRKLNSLDIQYLQTFSRGDLSERMKDCLELKSFFIRFFTFLLIDTVIGLFALTCLFIINWKITLVVVLALLLFVLWFYAVTPHIKKNEERRFVEKSNLYSALFENIDGLQVIKSFRLERIVMQRLAPRVRNILSIQRKVRYVDLLNSGVVNLILILASLTIIFLLSRSAIVDKGISMGQIITFIALSSQIFSTVSNILDENLSIQENKIILSRYFGFGLNKTEETEICNHEKIRCSAVDSILFKNVCFHYEPSNPIISNLDFTIRKGDKIKLMGKNGEGKSSFCKILSLLYPPVSGDIIINGVKHSFYDRNTLRSKILLVSNEDLVFNDTLRYNMAFDRPSDYLAILSLAREIGLFEYISEQKEGLDFVVHEQGRNLSTGQRKKILMMRAFLSDAEVIILDETLSGIDQGSREKIEHYINKQNDRSFIIISHEPLYYITFNTIIAMQNGSIEQLQYQGV